MSVTITAYVANAPELNLANGNFFKVMQQLGMSVDYCGEVSLEGIMDFRTSVLATLTLAQSYDCSVPSVTTKQPGQATIIECGWDADYLRERLTSLLEIVDYAIAHNVPVVWG